MSELKIVRGRVYFHHRRGGGWGVGTINPVGAKTFSNGQPFVGVLPTDVEDGDLVEVTGVEKKHPRFGMQLEVQAVLAHFPSDNSAIVEWMVMRLPNIGPKRAEALAERFGAELWEVIEHKPERLSEVSGITEERAQEICTAYEAHAAERQIILDLVELGLTATFAAKAVKMWRGEAGAVIRQNPYVLSIQLDIPLDDVDRIALRRLKVPKDDPRRIEAYVVAALQEALSSGDCSVLRHTLTRKVAVHLKLKVPVVTERLEDFEAVVVYDKQVLLESIDSAERIVAGKICDLMEGYE